MSAAFSWIGDLIYAIAQVFPRLVHVLATEGAVKFVRGRAVVLSPGLHFYWPVTSEVESIPVVRQVLELSTQTLTTSDVKSVVVGGVVTYRITDVHAFMVESYDAQDNLSEAAEAGIRRAVVERTFEDLQRARAKLDNGLARQVQRVVEPFGVEVESARLATFAAADVHSVVGDGFRLS